MSLNEKHKYYTQCQVQMAVTQVMHSYFFVWTPHGRFLQKLNFNQEYWNKLKQDFEEFYSNYYVPYLFQC